MAGEQLSKRALARKLGLSASAVLKLEKMGMPVSSVEQARAWRDSNLDPVRIKGSASKAERNDRSDALMLARLDREQAEAAMARLRLGEQAGELVRVDDVRAALAKRIVTLRETLLSLPSRLCNEIAAEADSGRVAETLDRELRACLLQVTDAPELGAKP